MPPTAPSVDVDASTDQDDPVKAEYDVYITPDLGAQLYLLQLTTVFPNEPFASRLSSQPAAVRIKPKSGFLEMEVPVDTTQNFNREKGVVFGQGLRKAKDEGSTSYGLASGFSGPNRNRNRNVVAPLAATEPASSRAHDQSVDDLIDDFEEAESRGQVLNKTVLGGQITFRDAGKPIYMLGSFRGNELHLSQLDGIAQMRPQFHHIDAQSQLDRNAARRELHSTEPSRQTEPRAVQMSFKPTGDDTQHIGTTDALLKAAQEETWIGLEHHDESSLESWNVYEKGLHIQDVENASELISSMTNDEYLDAISAPRSDLSPRKNNKQATRPKTQAPASAEGTHRDR